MKVKHRLDEEFGPFIELPVADPGKGLGSLQDWFQVFRVIQVSPLWQRRRITRLILQDPE